MPCPILASADLSFSVLASGLLADVSASVQGGDSALDALAGVLLLIVVFAAVGCLYLVIRAVVPGPVAAADRAVARLGVGRLLLSGVLPVVGAALVSWGVSYAPEPAQVAVVLVLGIPLFLLTTLGGAAAVPHVGRLVLRSGGEPRLLTSAVSGAIVIGLGGAAAALLGRQGGVALYVMLLLSWFLGVGLGALMPRGASATDEADAGGIEG